MSDLETIKSYLGLRNLDAAVQRHITAFLLGFKDALGMLMSAFFVVSNSVFIILVAGLGLEGASFESKVRWMLRFEFF